MPKLILSVDDKIIEEYSIDKNTITIGRRIDNDVCLDNLAISGYHSQITTVSHDCFLEDLNSTNGTFVNSKIVKKTGLFQILLIIMLCVSCKLKQFSNVTT